MSNDINQGGKKTFWENNKAKRAENRQKIEVKRAAKLQNRKALADARGPQLKKWPFSIDYLGGLDQFKKATGNLEFYQNRTVFHATFGKNKSFYINNNNIIDISIEGSQQVSRRVTATRLLTIGIFALAAQKKKVEKESFLTLILNNGQEVIFHKKGKSPTELKSKLAPVLSKIKQGTSPNAAPTLQPISVADELSKLAVLRNQGVISAEEFEKQKSKLLT